MSRVEVLASVDIAAIRFNPVSQRLELLLHRRSREPFAGEWALPGVLVNGQTADTSLDHAAHRALADKARIAPRHLEQVGTVGSAGRDPRGWSISTVYLALLAPGSDAPALADDLRWFDLLAVAQGHLKLPFDHNALAASAWERIGAKSVYSSLPLYLAPDGFSVADALKVSAACLGGPVNATSLRKRLERMREAGFIRDTGRKVQLMGPPQAVYEHVAEQGGPFMFDRSLLPTKGEGNV